MERNSRVICWLCRFSLSEMDFDWRGHRYSPKLNASRIAYMVVPGGLMTLIFYDTETTGLNSAFDQITQFAAIVTDDDYNVLEELDLRCRLKPHVIASPGAMRVTKSDPRRFNQRRCRATR